MRRPVLAVLVGFALGAAASCSFTTATGFTECTADSQCGASRACRDGYCLPLPERCVRTEGAFDKGDRIPLVALLPLTETPDGGARDESELQGLNAMSLAVFEANDREGLKGRRFALYSCNTGRSRDVLQQQLRWFVNELQVPAVITSGSGQTIAAAAEPSRADAGLMIMSATATSPELVEVYRRDFTVWRVAPPDTQQALVIEQLFRADAAYMGAQRIGVLYDDSAYGQGLAAATQERLALLGRSTRLVQFPVPLTDPAGIISQLESFAPQATVLVAFAPEVRTLIAEAATRPALTRANGHRWLLTDSSKDPSIIDAATGPQLADALGTAPAQGAGSSFSVFRDRFISRYGADPNNYSFTSHSYDGMYLVMLSAAWASGGGGPISGPRMNDGMRKLTGGARSYRLLGVDWVGASSDLASGQAIDAEGSSGRLDFDYDAGAPKSPYEVWRILPDGGFTTAGIVTP